ncbi:putative membrane protein [Noviherbaspirillum humi]|uniref:Putative membrane protein n=1 Tax=Noviherbaspirillum humi TaxID=1688639 RepID=A0A239IG24_9BURK|nr:DUF4142 domain-containing protein [Noviherbaspirillum humi]SNS91354.1 putative membrane protein [Noviherbaspirillum humi]
MPKLHHHSLRCMLAGAVLLASLQPLAAAAQGNHPPQGRAQSSAMTGADEDKAQISNADKNLMREMTQAHLFEIKMSALATAISRNDTVRTYAEKMLNEHVDALEDLRKLAAKSRVVLPGGLEKDQAGALHKLALAAGDEFDKMYLTQAGPESHQQSQRLFQEASGKAQSADLKDYAAKVLPVVNQHLQMAQKMTADPNSAAATAKANVSAGNAMNAPSPAGTQPPSGAAPAPAK